MMNSDSKPEIVEMYKTGLGTARWLFVLDPVQEIHRDFVRAWCSANLSGNWSLLDEDNDFFMYLACDDDDAMVVKLKFPE